MACPRPDPALRTERYGLHSRRWGRPLGLLLLVPLRHAEAAGTQRGQWRAPALPASPLPS